MPLRPRRLDFPESQRRLQGQKRKRLTRRVGEGSPAIRVGDESASVVDQRGHVGVARAQDAEGCEAVGAALRPRLLSPEGPRSLAGRRSTKVNGAGEVRLSTVLHYASAAK